MLAGLSIAHGFLPPHPSPTALVAQFGADIGRTLTFGLLVGIPTLAIAGPVFALTTRGVVARPPALFTPVDDTDATPLPGAWRSFSCALLPVALLGLRLAGGQVGQRRVVVADEGVGRVRARQDGRQLEARLQRGRHILERVHRDVRAAVLHRHFQLLEEQALAADGGQRAVEDLVAARGQRHQLHHESRMRLAQEDGHVLGLPQGQRALARGDTKRWGHGILAAARAKR